MTEFLLAIGLFLLAHIIPSLPRLRSFLIGLVGRPVYMFAYSLLSLALLAWVIVAALRAPYVALWSWQPWQSWVPVVFMPFAAWLVIAGLYEPTPLSISFRSTDGTGLGNAAAITRHPVLIGFFLWAASHIPPNGNLVALILFGVFASFSILGIVGLDRRSRRRLGPAEWQRLSSRTSILPFVALISGRARLDPRAPIVSTVIAALVFYFWFLFQGHALLIGIDPIGGL